MKSFEDCRARLVSFSGIDGAGKSTQIEALRSHLTARGLRVLLITFWDDVASLKRIRETASHNLFRGEKGVGTPDKPVNRRDKNVRSWYMTLVRLFLYFVDAISLRMAVTRALRANADVVIFDRYLYDELANLLLTNPVSRAYVRIMMMIVPRPDVSYILDVDPVQARARKPEYPLQFLHLSRSSYRNLSEFIGGMTILAPQSLEEVERQVLRTFEEATR